MTKNILKFLYKSEIEIIRNNIWNYNTNKRMDKN